MTRRDYEMLAAIFRDSDRRPEEGPLSAGWTRAICVLADGLAERNRQFDWPRFYANCTAPAHTFDQPASG